MGIYRPTGLLTGGAAERLEVYHRFGSHGLLLDRALK